MNRIILIKINGNPYIVDTYQSYNLVYKYSDCQLANPVAQLDHSRKKLLIPFKNKTKRQIKQLKNINQQIRKIKIEYENLEIIESVIGCKMNPSIDIDFDFDLSNNINTIHYLVSLLDETHENMIGVDQINYLMLQTGNQLNIIINFLDFEEFKLKDLILISETLTSNELIWKAGEIINSLKKKLIN